LRQVFPRSHKTKASPFPRTPFDATINNTTQPIQSNAPKSKGFFFFFNLREISEIDETHQMKNCGAIPHHGTEGFLKGFHENRTKKVESLS